MTHKRTLLFLLLAFVALALAWNVVVPPYENLDEIEHAEVIRYVAVTGRLPVHGAAETAGFAVRQEASQPPLYYLLGALGVRLLRLPTDPPAAFPVPGAVVACGPSESFYNKATWAHAPYQEDFPWQGPLLTLHGLRLFSTLLQVATVLGVWTLARRLFPRGWIAPVATAIVAFNPQFLLVAAGVNNDNLVTPLATWGLVVALDLWQHGPTVRRALLLGILSGLAALSKLSGLALIGLSGLVLLAWGWRERQPWYRLVLWGLLVGIPAVLLVAPWLARNLRLYGDLTALAPMLEIVGLQKTVLTDWGGLAQLMVLSYWGQLPCTFYPRALYWPFFLLLAGGGLGLGMGWRRFTATQRAGLTWAAVWFFVVVLAWIRWNSITPAPGGRLLFPAAAALALLLAAGWEALARQWRGHRQWIMRLWGVLLPVGAWVALRAGPLFLFAPPLLLPAEVTVPNPVHYTFGEAITLRGYTARLVEPRWLCWLASSAYCGPALETTLYWETDRPLDQDWVLALQLPSARPGDTTLRLSYTRWPGGGNLPTSAWPAGRIIVDRYLLPLPAADFPTQAWDVQVALLDLDNRVYLPVRAGETLVGDSVRLTALRVPGAQPNCPPQGALSSPPRLGEAVALTHAAVVPGAAVWQVTLCWESRAPLSLDATVFVHAYGSDGQLLATGDGPPMDNAFPTHLWQPGDRIADQHTLVLPAGVTPARIAVGLYDPATVTRLPAVQGADRLPDDAVIIWTAP